MAKKSEYLKELEKQYAEKHRLKLKLQKELKAINKKNAAKKKVKKKSVKKKVAKRVVKKKVLKKKVVKKRIVRKAPKKRVVKRKPALPVLAAPGFKQKKLPVLKYPKKKKSIFDDLFKVKKKKVVKKVPKRKKKDIFSGLFKVKKRRITKKVPRKKKRDIFGGLFKHKKKVVKPEPKKALPVLKFKEKELKAPKKKKSLFDVFKKKRRVIKKVSKYDKGPGFERVLKDVFLGDEKKVYVENKKPTKAKPKKNLPALKFKEKELKAPAPKKRKEGGLWDIFKSKKKEKPVVKMAPLEFPNLDDIVAAERKSRKISLPQSGAVRRAVEEKHLVRRQNAMESFLKKIKTDKNKLHKEELRRLEEQRNSKIVRALKEKLDRESEHVLDEPKYKVAELVDLCFVSIKRKQISKAEFYYEQMKPYYDKMGGMEKRHALSVIMRLQNDLVMLRMKLFKDSLRRRRF